MRWEGRRPHMPGYGIAGPGEGRGLLPWAWAEERLSASRHYWVASVRRDVRPHVVPVWGVWWSDAWWFSASRSSRKARNLTANPQCVVTTENALEPVVLDGTASLVRDPEAIRDFAERMNDKYGTDYGPDFYGAEANCVVRVAPDSIFGLDSTDFSGTPTRWTPVASETAR